MKGDLNMKKELLELRLQLFGDELGVEDSDFAESDEELDGETPSTDEESDEEEDETDEEESATESNVESEPQDFKNEHNAMFANMRRRAQAEAQAKYDSEIAKLCEGYVHPVTKQPIRTFAEYKDALYQQERLANEEKLKESGLDPKMIDNAVANSPMVREAQAILMQSRRENAERTLQSEFAEIQKFDSSITSFDTIPNIEIITQMVEHGYNLVDAYKLVNFESLMQRKVAGAKQGAINQIKGKSHMVGVDSIAQENDSSEIPTDVLKMYKEIYPDKSSAELKKLYKQTSKKLGGI